MSWWSGRSIRVRLVILYTLALAVVLVPYAAGSYLFMRVHLLKTMDEALHGEAEEAIMVMSEAVQLAGAKPETLHSALQRLEAVEDVQYELWSPAGELTYRRGMTDAVRRSLPAIGKDSGVFSVRPQGRDRFRVLEQPVVLAGQPFLFRVVAREEPVRATLARLMAIQAAGLVGALLFAGIGGYFLARRVLSPVRLITEEARLLTAARLKDGIPVVNPGDELGQLAQTFNDVFRKLDASFERLREFTADASHELRTPLTAIQSVAEVGLGRGDDGKRESLESILEETLHMKMILDGLLMLARAEDRQLPLSPSAVDLSELCRDVVTQLTILAEEKSQTLRLDAEAPVIVQADRSYVRHALMNVVDNAIKHGHENRPITVKVERIGNHGAILVTDQGPGIATADRDKVFERFYQVDKARSRSQGGSGLGLSIASWAIKANGGTIELESHEGKGSTFRVKLPVESED